ncbi:MAG: patatin-like phospholipase family protein [Verrucomicrobiota bacterium]
MNENAKILRSHPVFSRFSSGTLRKLTTNASLVQFPKGETVYDKGDHGDSLYVVLTGRCQSQEIFSDGTTHVMNTYFPGTTFGERALLSKDRQPNTVKVITDSTLMRLDAKDVHALVNKDPAVARQLLDRVRVQMRRHMEDKELTKLGRVVALSSLSCHVLGPTITENLAIALRRETNRSVLCVHVSTGDDTPSINAWEQIETPLNGTFCYADFVEKTASGTRRLHLHVGEEDEHEKSVASLIGHMAGHYRYVLIHINHEVASSITHKFLLQSDLPYILLGQDASDLCQANLLLKQIKGQYPDQPTQLLPLVCLEHGERARPFNKLREKVGATIHGIIHHFPPHDGDTDVHYTNNREDRFSSHIRHVAREVGRCRVGLALSSGGAKGLAHIGLIQVLEENGIDVDTIAGVSMGAFIGALWAFGMSCKEMEHYALELERRFSMLRLVDPAFPPRRGWMRGFAIRRWLERLIGTVHFSDLTRKLFVITADLNTLERVVFEEGEVISPIHASMAMPGVMVPVRLGDRVFIDGGVAEPIPMRSLLETGVEKIIAVNSILNPDELKERMIIQQENAQRPNFVKRVGSYLNQQLNYFANGNVLDIMYTSMHGAQIRMAEGACRQADVVIRPVSCEGKWNDFGNVRHYIRLGREAAERELKDLKALVRT